MFNTSANTLDAKQPPSRAPDARVQALAHEPVLRVDCGFAHSAAISASRELYMCGARAARARGKRARRWARGARAHSLAREEAPPSRPSPARPPAPPLASLSRSLGARALAGGARARAQARLGPEALTAECYCSLPTPVALRDPRDERARAAGAARAQGLVRQRAHGRDRGGRQPVGVGCGDGGRLGLGKDDKRSRPSPVLVDEVRGPASGGGGGCSRGPLSLSLSLSLSLALSLSLSVG